MLESPRGVNDIDQGTPTCSPTLLPENARIHADPDMENDRVARGQGSLFWMECRRGRKREHCEDVGLSVPSNSVKGHQWSLFAVFDGHGGREAADFARSNFSRILFEEMEKREPIQALRSAFLKTNEEFLRQTPYDSGTTAVVALVRKGEMFIAHVGDSRCVVSRGGSGVCLTKDHRATREEEANRVEELGGFVLMRRVQGVLAVSRSIGDRKYDQYVTAEPDIQRQPIGSNDEFLVLGTDGLWDLVGTQEAVDEIQDNISRGLHVAADRLAALAQEKGSSDDITVSIISLHPYHSLRYNLEDV